MFKPVNRYIHINVANEKPAERSSGIVLPDDYAPAKNSHLTTTVVAWSPDVRFAEQLTENCEIIVDRSMVEEITTPKGKFNVILDNYVIGIV